MTNLFYLGGGPLPYESIFSVYLKISHNNFMPLAALAKKLGGSRQEGRNRARWLFSAKTEENLEAFLPDLAQHLPWTYAPMTALFSPAYILSFCDECIRFGYHSVFNSIMFHRVCALHKRELRVACSICTRTFLKGFVDSDRIPHWTEVCEKCGFQEISARKEIRMRRDPDLKGALDRFGREQAIWYRKISGVITPEFTGYSDLYYDSMLARSELSGSFEQYLNMRSPERLAGGQPMRMPIAFVGRFRSYVGGTHYRGPTFNSMDNRRLHSQAEILIRLKARFLSRHLSCFNRICQLAEYPNGQPKEISLCPLAMAYVLLCIKASHDSWPSPGSDCHQMLSLDSENGSSATWRSCWDYREAVLLFLTILARLEHYLYQEESFFVVCRPEVNYFVSSKVGVLIRKSSYSFRSCCRNLRCSYVVSRDGVGGPLLISSATHNEHLDYSDRTRVLSI